MDAKVMLDFQSYDFHPEVDEGQITIRHLLSDLFPYYQLKSFVTASLATHFLLYVINLLLIAMYGAPFDSNSESAMVDALECYPYDIKNLQLYRVFTALLITPTMDSLLAHTVFNLMFVSFVQRKLGSRETVVLYYGTGVVGNIFSILMTDRPCISNIGSLSLFLLSLKLEHDLFKADNYKNYENYHQSVGLYFYKGAVYCFLVYHYTSYEDFTNFYMFLGGILVLVLSQFTGSLSLLPTTVLGVGVFLQYRAPSF